MTREEIYLAALLHDIGKFYQRADDPLNGSKELSALSKNMVQYICPDFKGFPSHQHVVWTNEFFEKTKSVFTSFISNEELNHIAHSAVYHHRPDDLYAAIIQMADWWASGMDRSSMGIFEDPQLESNELRFREIPLNNIMCALRVKQNNNEFHTSPRQTVFKLKPLSLIKEDIFPNSYTNETKLSTAHYREHWGAFIDEFKSLPSRSFDIRGFSTTLHYVLKKYTWCIPSFTQNNHPCISLFEHSKITAAIAQCIFDFYSYNQDKFHTHSTPSGLQIEIDDEIYPLLLVGFDLSGIQDYLYNISSANAAKSLRGRSFYLQMSVEALAWKIINENPYPASPSHVIYASGGKFYMLLPNLANVRDFLNNFYEKVLDDLWKKHKGRLYLNMGAIAFRYKNKMEKDAPNIRIEGEEENVTIGALWDRVFVEMTSREAQRFRKIITSKDHFHKFFEPSEDGGDAIVCSVTGEEIEPEKGYYVFNEEKRDWYHKKQIEPDIDYSAIISEEAYEQIRIGEQLVNHRFIAIPTARTKAGDLINLPGGTSIHIVREVNSYDEATMLKTVQDKIDLVEMPPGNRQALGFRFFGGSRVAILENHKPATFEHLAGYGDEKGKDKYPFKRLAILRMDVDGLGTLFRYGFTEDQQASDLASFSAYATFSNFLDLFFSGYLNSLREKYKDDVNILYSGGDDIFAIGYWEKVIAFAWDIREEFKKFTGRDDLTVSAGIELVGAKFPIAKGAEIAGVAEEKAKNHKILSANGVEMKKNSVCIFGVPLNWDIEWKDVVDLKNKLVDWVEKKYISKGLLMQLIGYYEAWKYNTSYAKTKEYHNWKWQAAYNIARRQKLVKESNPGAFAVLEELKQILFAEVNEHRLRFDAFAVACRWAELTLRNMKES